MKKEEGNNKTKLDKIFNETIKNGIETSNNQKSIELNEDIKIGSEIHLNKIPSIQSKEIPFKKHYDYDFRYSRVINFLSNRLVSNYFIMISVISILITILMISYNYVNYYLLIVIYIFSFFTASIGIIGLILYRKRKKAGYVKVIRGYRDIINNISDSIQTAKYEIILFSNSVNSNLDYTFINKLAESWFNSSKKQDIEMIEILVIDNEMELLNNFKKFKKQQKELGVRLYIFDKMKALLIEELFRNYVRPYNDYVIVDDIVYELIYDDNNEIVKTNKYTRDSNIIIKHKKFSKLFIDHVEKKELVNKIKKK